MLHVSSQSDRYINIQIQLTRFKIARNEDVYTMWMNGSMDEWGWLVDVYSRCSLVIFQGPRNVSDGKRKLIHNTLRTRWR